MSPQLLLLLSMIPEPKQDEFVRRLPYPAARAIVFNLEPDAQTLQVIADAVWQSLEDGTAVRPAGQRLV